MPKYLVKLPDEAAWVAWLGSVTGLVVVLMLYFGVDAEIVAAVAAVLASTGRMITGLLLPTPTQEEAVADAIANTESG